MDETLIAMKSVIPIENKEESLDQNLNQTEISQIGTKQIYSSERMNFENKTNRIEFKNSKQLSRSVEHLPDDAYIIIFDFINYLLKCHNLPWPDCPDLPENPSPAVLAMRKLGTKFQKRYREKLAEEIPICTITQESSLTEFIEIALALFTEEGSENENMKISWGRIICFFAFSGFLAMQRYRSGQRYLIYNLAQWTAIFTEWKLQSWIDLNGGWDGLVEFEKKIKTNDKKMRLLRRIAGAGAVVSLTALVLWAVIVSVKS